MSVSSGPPELPPDSPGSSVSSRLQDEYTDIINRAVVLSNDGQRVTATMNPLMVGSGKTTSKRRNDPSNDLIDLSSPNSPRTNSEADTYRQQLSHIPSLEQLLSTDQRVAENQALSKDFDDPLVPHLVRYSELVSNDLESKPVNEKMDHWYLDMKKNLMNEFDKLRLQFLEEAQQVALKEKQAQAKEYVRLNQDIQTMREMLTRYERTIDEKDKNEKNLNKALDLLYNKTVAYRRYYEWRLIHLERRQQQYSLSLAKRFYEDKLKRKALSQWKTTVDKEWKKRFENACERKAKDVLVELGQEYESKYKQLEEQLFNANEEIARLKSDQGDHDEELKKAFMRGVCALNMEAMSVLLKNPQDAQTMPFINDIQRKLCEQYHQTSSNDIETNEPLNSSPLSHPCETRHPPTFPSHVYKESLPNTIYRSGEARAYRPTSTNPHHVRQVTFQKHPTTTTTQRNRTRSSTSSVFVERHVPTNHIHS